MSDSMTTWLIENGKKVGVKFKSLKDEAADDAVAAGKTVKKLVTHPIDSVHEAADYWDKMYDIQVKARKVALVVKSYVDELTAIYHTLDKMQHKICGKEVVNFGQSCMAARALVMEELPVLAETAAITAETGWGPVVIAIVTVSKVTLDGGSLALSMAELITCLANNHNASHMTADEQKTAAESEKSLKGLSDKVSSVNKIMKPVMSVIKEYRELQKYVNKTGL